MALTTVRLKRRSCCTMDGNGRLLVVSVHWSRQSRWRFMSANDARRTATLEARTELGKRDPGYSALQSDGNGQHKNRWSVGLVSVLSCGTTSETGKSCGAVCTHAWTSQHPFRLLSPLCRRRSFWERPCTPVESTASDSCHILPASTELAEDNPTLSTPYMGSSLCSAQSGGIKRLAGGMLLCILKCFKLGHLGSMRRCELSRRGSAYTHLKGCRTLFCQLSCVWCVSQVSMPYRRDFQRNQNLVRSVETPVTILH